MLLIITIDILIIKRYKDQIKKYKNIKILFWKLKNKEDEN